MSARIPPAHEELEFVRNKATGRVHIRQYFPHPGEPGYAEPEPVSFTEGLALMFTTPQPMICGVRMVVGDWPTASGIWENEFPDNDLCIRCVKALGDQSARAFEGHHPEEEE